MCTNYTPSYYSMYFRIFVSYTSSVKFVKFPIVCCTSPKSFMDKLCLGKCYETSKSKKVIKFYVHISPIFLLPGHLQLCILPYIGYQLVRLKFCLKLICQVIDSKWLYLVVGHLCQITYNLKLFKLNIKSDYCCSPLLNKTFLFISSSRHILGINK